MRWRGARSSVCRTAEAGRSPTRVSSSTTASAYPTTRPTTWRYLSRAITATPPSCRHPPRRRRPLCRGCSWRRGGYCSYCASTGLVRRPASPAARGSGHAAAVRAARRRVAGLRRRRSWVDKASPRSALTPRRSASGVRRRTRRSYGEF